RELLRVGETARARAEAETGWENLSTALANGLRPAVVLPATIAAYLRLDQHDIDGVIEIIDVAAPWSEGHPNLHLLRAAALLMRGNPSDISAAVTSLEACLAAGTGLFTHEVLPGATSWAAQTQLGVARLLAGRPADALGCFSEALSIQPDHHHARYGAAEALLALGRPAEALSVVEPSLSSGSSDGWLIAASAALSLQKFEDAAMLLSRATELPTSSRRIALRDSVRAALDGRSLLEQMTGGVPSAVDTPADTLLEDGENRFEAGDLDGAVDRFVRALTIAPGSAEGWCNLGVGMHAAGLMNNAERALRMALRQQPDYREALASLGLVCAERGRPDQAAAAFRQLLDAYPGDEVAISALQAMGLQQPQAAGSTPLLSVLLTASSAESLERCLDQLSLQDLHPTLFEVFALSEVTRVDERGYRLQLLESDQLDDAIEASLGRWLVLLSADDLPSRDLLRRHLAAQVTAPHPCAVRGARGFEEGRRHSEPLVAALAEISQPHPPLSNLSLPREEAESLSQLRWRPEASPVALQIHDEIRCWRGEAITLDSLIATAVAQGRAATRAGQADPTIPLPDVPGEPGREESWLGMRMLYERQQPLIEKLRTDLAGNLEAGRPISSEGLGHLLRQARRRGLIEASLGAGEENPRSLASALTSIIIPNLNGMPHLVTAVESLRQHTRGPVELIVIDNGSDDGSLEWLRQQPDICLLEMGENLGAPAARNRGLAIARGETILMCDNDVVFTPGWRPTLLGHLEAWPDIGMVGPMSDYVIGHQKFEGAPDRDGPVMLDDFAARFHSERKGAHTYSHRLILFFLLARREVIETIGGIDEGYGRWGFEDDDLCVRVRLAGYKMRVAQDCFIRHLGSQTARSANLDYNQLLLDNWEIFKTKWRLDPAMPYGPYDPGEITSQRFAPEELYVPYRVADAPPPSDPIKLIAMC
ncbi:MAG: GT2 family glycosyltransferase/tetratricopeptide (TPR) repeat protein, partial [Myxococcota bacterium]